MWWLYQYTKDEEEQLINLVVEDKGIGIPIAMLESIFRIDSTTGRSGIEIEKSTGFGLILVNELVGLLGGKYSLKVWKAGYTGECDFS